MAEEAHSWVEAHVRAIVEVVLDCAEEGEVVLDHELG